MGETHLAGTNGFCRSHHLGLASSFLGPCLSFSSPSSIPETEAPSDDDGNHSRGIHPVTGLSTIRFALLISSHPISPSPHSALSSERNGWIPSTWCGTVKYSNIVRSFPCSLSVLVARSDPTCEIDIRNRASLCVSVCHSRLPVARCCPVAIGV